MESGRHKKQSLNTLATSNAESVRNETKDLFTVQSRLANGIKVDLLKV